MLGDYLRAAAGLVPIAADFRDRVGRRRGRGACSAALRAIFGVFGVRTALRHGTSLEMSDTGLRAVGPAAR